MTAAEIEARELALLRAEAGGESFAAFVGRVTPRYRVVPRHLRRLYAVCEATRHREVFARISMPPRHGKTETLSHLLGWRAREDPGVLNFYVTYGDSLANATMRKTTKVAQRAGITFSRDVKNLQEWHVAGYDGGLMCTTVGGQITGRGCNGGVVIGDDLIKGRRNVESRLQRDVVWDFLKDDMMSRLEYGASMILCATRWHPDDPHGRLDKDPLGLDWEDVILPAVHDGDYNAVDERTEEGGRLATPLAPSFGYDLAWARKQRARGEYGWWSLYQQQPRPRNRQLFTEPARFDLRSFSMQGKRLIIGCDVAGTVKTYSDWSAFVVMAVAGWEDRMEAWILHAEKLQASTDKVAEVFLRAQRKWRALLAVEVNGVGRGVADQVRAPRAQPDMLRRVSGKLRMVEVTRTQDKYLTAQAFSAAWSGSPQRVYVPLEASWDVDDYIAVHKEFTGVDDPEDDLVDAGVNGWNCLWRAAAVGSSVRTEYAEDF